MEFRESLQNLVLKLREIDSKNKFGEDASDGSINIHAIGKVTDNNFKELNAEFIQTIKVIKETFLIQEKKSIMAILSYLDELDDRKDGLIEIDALALFIERILISQETHFNRDNFINHLKSIAKILQTSNEDKAAAVELEHIIHCFQTESSFNDN